VPKDWSRYAKALDMRLEGVSVSDIAREFGVSKQRASGMIKLAQRQLAFRLYKGVPRPLPDPNGRYDLRKLIVLTR